MQSEVITAILAFAGTCIGTLGGILASAKLISYRIEQLESSRKKLKWQTTESRTWKGRPSMSNEEKDLIELLTDKFSRRRN